MPATTGKRIRPTIGVTGSIGAGKSTVSHLLASMGAALFDADAAAHDQLAEPEVIAALVDWWGRSILDARGQVDRAAVAAIVFDDPTQLARLEGLLYPRIERRRAHWVRHSEACRDCRAVVLDVPKLYEAGLDRLCDRVILVDADTGIRIQRLGRSRGWTGSDLIRREKFLDPL
ncbi:MAG: dephospho-CoA kinase, partial [Phycisphaerae bacterium]